MVCCDSLPLTHHLSAHATLVFTPLRASLSLHMDHFISTVGSVTYHKDPIIYSTLRETADVGSIITIQVSEGFLGCTRCLVVSSRIACCSVG